jgi:hypothetical protein
MAQVQAGFLEQRLVELREFSDASHRADNAGEAA